MKRTAAHSLHVAALVVVVLLAGCSGGGQGASGESASRPVGGRQDDELKAEAGSLVWGDCTEQLAVLAQLECATMDVPVDHDDPDGATISMAVARKAATGDKADRIGSLVINPGGPGVSGITFLAGATAMFPPELTERFDLVSFDPRGVAESTPLICLTDEEREEQLSGDLTPDSPAAVDQALEDQAALLEGCESDQGQLLKHLSTADVAADLDLLREELGDEQLTYMGFSYGTSIGATYATLFPEQTRALVLDGSVSPDASREDQLVAQAEGFAKVYESFVEVCNATPQCPLAPDADAAITAARAALVDTPVKVTTTSGERELTADMFDMAVATGLYTPMIWSPMATAIAEVDQGGAATLLALVDQQTGRQPDGSYSNAAESRAAINCADDPGRPTAEEAAAAAKRIAARVPVFGEAVGWGMLSCVGWPEPANPTPIPTGAGAPPILVVGTVGDPATPYSWSQQMADALESGVLLTYEGDGHTAFSSGGACIQDVVTAFLVDLEVPAAGTTCPSQDSGGFVPMRDTVIEQFTASGIPESVAECIVDAVIDEVGESQFEAMIIANDPSQLTGMVTGHALNCATNG